MTQPIHIDQQDSAENLWRQTIANQVANKYYGQLDPYLLENICKFILNGDPNGQVVSRTDYTNCNYRSTRNLLDISKENQMSESLQEKLKQAAYELEVILHELLRRIEEGEDIEHP